MSDRDRAGGGMSLTRFAAIVEAYGSAPQRWPGSERAAAEALLAASAEARALREAAAPLDAALSLSPAPAPSAALRAGLLQAAPRSAPARPNPRGFWQALPGILAGEFGEPRPAGAMLGVALLLGMAAGGALGTQVLPAAEFAVADDVDVVQIAMFDEQLAEY